MSLERFYETVGGDLSATAARLGGAVLAERFLRLFAGDDTFDMLSAAMTAGDTQRAFRAAHTLKGVAANLGLSRLCEASSALTEALRSGDMPAAQALYPAAATAYRQVRTGIDQLDTDA